MLSRFVEIDTKLLIKVFWKGIVIPCIVAGKSKEFTSNTKFFEKGIDNTSQVLASIRPYRVVLI
jgi:hypothetical protein